MPQSFCPQVRSYLINRVRIVTSCEELVHQCIVSKLMSLLRMSNLLICCECRAFQHSKCRICLSLLWMFLKPIRFALMSIVKFWDTLSNIMTFFIHYQNIPHIFTDYLSVKNGLKCKFCVTFSRKKIDSLFCLCCDIFLGYQIRSRKDRGFMSLHAKLQASPDKRQLVIKSLCRIKGNSSH